MRRTFWCLIAAAVVILGWSAGAQTIQQGEPARFGVGSAGLITHFSVSEGRPTQVAILDPQSRVLSVYYISPNDGQIQLKSVRPLTWDFEMNGFNTGDPLPKDIQAGLQRRP